MDYMPEKPVETCPYKEPTVNIKSGSRGEGAKWVQWHLQKTVAPEIVVDGVFGAKSKAATIEFQKTYGLDADGIVGKATRPVMKNAL